MAKETKTVKAIERRAEMRRNRAKQMKSKREQKTKRSFGAVKKVAQLGMLPDVDTAIFIYYRHTGQYQTFSSTDEAPWKSCVDYIKQTSPTSEHLVPRDFVLVERDENSPRKLLPDIKLRESSRSNRRGRNLSRQRTTTPSISSSPILLSSPISPSSPFPPFSPVLTTGCSEPRLPFMTPPPQLPDFIRDLALQHRRNTSCNLPDLSTTRSKQWNTKVFTDGPRLGATTSARL